MVDPYDDDLSYLRDLGLITQRGEARVANPNDREVIVRAVDQYGGPWANIWRDPAGAAAVRAVTGAMRPRRRSWRAASRS